MCYFGRMARAQKVSIALDKGVLARAKKAAASDGLSLSGMLENLLVEHFERETTLDNMTRFLDEHAPKMHVTERDMQKIRAEMSAPLRPIRRARKKRAA